MTDDILSNIPSPVIIREEIGNVIYEGRSAHANPNTGDKVWQIKRIIRNGSTTITQYAVDNTEDSKWHKNNVRTNCIWDDRATYFGPITLNDITLVDALVPAGISYSNSLNIKNAFGFSLQETWSGAPAASGVNIISVQCSVDGSAWDYMLDSDENIFGDGDLMLVVSASYYNHIRMKFDFENAINVKVTYSDRKV